MNYKFGNKNNWRRWVWNRISEKLKGSWPPGRVLPKNARVLYLAGEDDLDRPIARAHGFRDENLIAVDISQKVVEKLRDDGVIAIKERVEEVLLAWPSNREVHVLCLDFCCGFDVRLCNAVVAAFKNPAFLTSIVMVNFQRGRERPESMKVIKEFAGKARKLVGSELHRAAIFVATYFGTACGQGFGGLGQVLHKENGPIIRCSFFSYRSAAGVMMDSVVMDRHNGMLGRGIVKWLQKNKDCVRKFEQLRSQRPFVVRKVAAALALQTMRGQ